MRSESRAGAAAKASEIQTALGEMCVSVLEKLGRPSFIFLFMHKLYACDVTLAVLLLFFFHLIRALGL